MENLLALLPPAIIIAIAAYLVRFFGKAVSDQKPFADNWEWMIEVSGVSFLVTFLTIPVAIGIDAALRWHDFGLWALISFLFGSGISQWMSTNLNAGHAVRLLAVLAINYRLLIRNAAALERVYKVSSRWLRDIAKTRAKFKRDEGEYENYLKKVLEKKYSPLWLPLMVIVLSYVVTLEYLSGSIYWLVILGVSAFGCLVSIALDYSMSSILKLPEVDVYLEGFKKKPFRAILLKASERHLRLRKDDKVIIVDRNRVSRFEVDVEKYER